MNVAIIAPMPTTPIGSLYQKTLVLLKSRGIPLLEIHKQSGISFYWLKRFSEGRLRDPSVNRVQALYEFLTNKTLGV